MLKIECKCGNDFENTYTKFRSSSKSCRECVINGIRDQRGIGQEEFERRVFDLVGEEYTVLGAYINSSQKIKMIHNVCNKEFEMLPYAFCGSNQDRCPHCYRCFKKTNEEFQYELNKSLGDDYTLVSEYLSASKHLTIRHDICNHEWTTSPASALKSMGCPFCNNESRGERKIREYLESMNLTFEREYKNDNLLSKKNWKLRIDFCLFNDLGKEVLFIEYDGEHHYRDIYYNRSLVDQKERDKIKDDYSKNMNIPMLRIPYTSYDDIEDILAQELKNIDI